LPVALRVERRVRPLSLRRRAQTTAKPVKEAMRTEPLSQDDSVPERSASRNATRKVPISVTIPESRDLAIEESRLRYARVAE
jgi:hypothetical protein